VNLEEHRDPQPKSLRTATSGSKGKIISSAEAARPADYSWETPTPPKGFQEHLPYKHPNPVRRNPRRNIEPEGLHIRRGLDQNRHRVSAKRKCPSQPPPTPSKPGKTKASPIYKRTMYVTAFPAPFRTANQPYELLSPHPGRTSPEQGGGRKGGSGLQRIPAQRPGYRQVQLRNLRPQPD